MIINVRDREFCYLFTVLNSHDIINIIPFNKNISVVFAK